MTYDEDDDEEVGNVGLLHASGDNHVWGQRRVQDSKVIRKLYHNLYHRPPALASAHERRIARIPLFPALTSAHERSTHI